MNILLSWSGEVSHEIAKHLREWLPLVIPEFKPWVSSEDIDKGTAWWEELHRVLADPEMKAVVVIVTPENVRSPWLYYESGAIAAKLDRRVCPYLVKVPIKQILGTPFGGFQCTEADKTDTLKLVRSLHKFIGAPHAEVIFEGNFANRWLSLKGKLERATEGLEPVEDEVKTTEPSIAEQLSEQAKELLVAAGTAQGNRQGLIMVTSTNAGRLIHAGGKNFGESGNPRSQALWRDALEQLRQLGLVDSSNGQSFNMTHLGFKVADQLKPPAPAVGPPPG
jgi:hypothetical protein